MDVIIGFGFCVVCLLCTCKLNSSRLEKEENEREERGGIQPIHTYYGWVHICRIAPSRRATLRPAAKIEMDSILAMRQRGTARQGDVT